MEVSGQLYVPAALLPGKEPHVPIVQEAGRAPEPVGTLWSREKSLGPAGNKTAAVQHVARRYTDPTIPDLNKELMYVYVKIATRYILHNL
jgi:hypothetical protein